jgi:hypothetical protein
MSPVTELSPPRLRARPQLHKGMIRSSADDPAKMEADSTLCNSDWFSCSLWGGCGYSDRCDCCTACTSCATQ